MKGPKKIFEEIIDENFPNMGKEIATQVQEMQRAPYRINTLRHIVIKLEKINDRKIIESSNGKMTNNIQGNSHKVKSRFLSRNSTSRKGVARYI